MQKAGKEPPQLNQQAFAAPPRVAAATAAVNDALASTYPAAVAKIQLYITKPKARCALLRPIRSNIAEALSHVAALLQEHYTEAEAASVPLLVGDALTARLDAAERGGGEGGASGTGGD